MGVDRRFIRVGARAWDPVAARLLAAFAACVACALLLGLGLARAEAAPGWLPATNLSTPLRDASNVSVAMDDAGGAIAVWQRSGFPTHPVQVAIKGAGTGFGGPIDLSATGGNPFMAMSRTGTAVVAYQQLVGGKNMVRIHLRSPGGDFSGPIDVAETAPGGASVRPKVAVNPAGDVAVAWRDRLPIGEEEGKTVYSEGFVIRVSVKPAGGAFSAPFDLSDVGHTSDNPQVAVRDDGEVTVAWSGYTDSEDKLIQVSEGAAGGFSEPVEVSSADEANDPQLALDPSGESALLWRAREIVGEDEDEEPIFSPPALEASVGSGGTFDGPRHALRSGLRRPRRRGCRSARVARGWRSGPPSRRANTSSAPPRGRTAARSGRGST